MHPATLPAPAPALAPALASAAPSVDHEPDVTALILRWQSTGDRDAFAALAAAVAVTVEAVAATELRRRGRHDTALVADALSLVLDHLRRLHRVGANEQPVSAFRPVAGCDPGAGLVYVRWLARRRVADLARSQRRRDRHEPTFTRCFGDTCDPAGAATATIASHPASAPPLPADSLQALDAASRRLDEADRTLADALLTGMSQVEIARRLGVSAGTITRRRQRLLARMASTLRADGDGGPPLAAPGPAAAAAAERRVPDCIARSDGTVAAAAAAAAGAFLDFLFDLATASSAETEFDDDVEWRRALRFLAARLLSSLRSTDETIESSRK
jgi:DNA-directed RNA polymerase specialized sigma24 family protein